VANWTEDELRATVSAYLGMLELEQKGTPFSKAGVRRALRKGALKARSEPSIEYRMRNISAVLADHGRPIIKGYLPAANVGDANRQALWSLVEAEEAKPGRPAPPLPAPAGAVSTPRLQQPRPPMIYFNIGWMAGYAGVTSADLTKGAHGYLKEHAHGAEAFNFRPTAAGTVQGYRPPGTRQRAGIEALGVPPGATTATGVLVVWLAKEPASKRTLVVGWYRNATVHREAIELATEVNGERISYTAEATESDATLVPTALRTFQVMSSRVSPGAGFGQNPTWYGAEPVNAALWDYVQAYDARQQSLRRAAPLVPPKNADPELRRKVEKAAVAHATAYYEALLGSGYEVRSVEAEAKGWDLEVHGGEAPILVEVKGLLGQALACELTPNEYEKMLKPENRERYVIYVVNNALAEAPAVPIASVFEHAGGASWRTADGRDLVITPKVAAVLSCS
jgi:hypothetical protein